MGLGELLTLSGYLVGALVLFLESRRRNLNTEGMRIVAIAGLVCGVAGAKVTQWFFSSGVPLVALLQPQNGGKSLVGGLIFGWLGVEVAKRHLGIRRSTGDSWALALPAGEAVGRLGCYFNGCCIGTPFQGSWAVLQVGFERHPTQIYSAVGAALLFGVLWQLRDSLPREGDLFKMYLTLYGVSRFGIEFFRERNYVFLQMSMVQIICLEVAIFALIGLTLSFRRSCIKTT
jgi:phosphatidylglycerol:prolipoprotein diacylglycerol transferase